MTGYSNGFPAAVAEKPTRKELKARIAELKEEIDDLVAENLHLIHKKNEAQLDAARYKADYEGACVTIAQMHEAATGRVGYGPIRGVVEDVEDIRIERDGWIETARTYAQNADYWREQLEQLKQTVAAAPPYDSRDFPADDSGDVLDWEQDWSDYSDDDYLNNRDDDDPAQWLKPSPNHPSLWDSTEPGVVRNSFPITFDPHNLISQTYPYVTLFTTVQL